MSSACCRATFRCSRPRAPDCSSIASRDNDEVAAIGPGFVEALPDRVLVLTDAFLKPANIDKAAAERDLAAAERAVAEIKGRLESPEHVEAQRQLDWARARVDASKAA